jgi:hypothetical protein
MLVLKENKLNEVSPYNKLSAAEFLNILRQHKKEALFQWVELQYTNGMCASRFYGNFSVDTVTDKFVDLRDGKNTFQYISDNSTLEIFVFQEHMTIVRKYTPDFLLGFKNKAIRGYFI